MSDFFCTSMNSAACDFAEAFGSNLGVLWPPAQAAIRAVADKLTQRRERGRTTNAGMVAPRSDEASPFGWPAPI